MTGAPPLGSPPNSVASTTEPRGEGDAWVNESGRWKRATGVAPRVLIIEDEVVIALLLAMTLKRMGFEVIGQVGTEAAAVAAAAASRPDIMLVDNRLREGSGLGAVTQILRDGFIPHIHMSGHPMDTTRLGAGVAALQKPFTDRALELAIAQILNPRL